MDTRERLLQTFEDILGERVEPEQLNSDLAAWDSLAHLNLILALEEEFEVEIPPEDFLQLHSNIHTIQEYLESKF